MSTPQDNALVEAFNAMVHVNAQSMMGSPLMSMVNSMTQVASTDYYSHIGNVETVNKSRTFSATPENQIAVGMRALSCTPRHISLPILSQDITESMIDLKNNYMKASVWAHGRQFTREIVGGLVSPVVIRTFDSATHQPSFETLKFPLSQRYAVLNGSGALGSLTYQKMVDAYTIFDNNNFSISPAGLVVCSTPEVFKTLLTDEHFINKDYFKQAMSPTTGVFQDVLGTTYVKLLPDVQLGAPADVATIKFDTGTGEAKIGQSSGVTGTLSTLGSYDRLVIFDKEVAYHATQPSQQITRMGERADRSYDEQIYTRSSGGFLRIEDKGVLELYIKKAKGGLAG